MVKSDKGPPFQGETWKQYLRNCSIKHRKITPLWPQANAQAESLNKPLMKAIKAAAAEGRNWKRELYKCLQTYRCTQHTSTQFTPYRLLFGRDPRTKLPELLHQSTHPDHVRARDTEAKATMKKHADQRALTSKLHAGDVVLVKQPKLNKISSRYNPKPMVIKDRKGSMVKARHPQGPSITRNSSHFQNIPDMTLTDIMSQLLPEPNLPQPTQISTHQNSEMTIEPGLNLSAPEHLPPQTRPKRTILQPKRLTEEM